MLARCPVCQTVFRVRPEQLRAHGGQVRCGHCLNAFDAPSNLLEEGTSAAVAQPSAETVAPEALQETSAPPPLAAGQSSTAAEAGEEPEPAPQAEQTKVDLDLTELPPPRPPIPGEHFFVLEERGAEGESERQSATSDELDFDIPDSLLPSRPLKAPASAGHSVTSRLTPAPLEFDSHFEPIEFIEPPAPASGTTPEAVAEEDSHDLDFREPTSAPTNSMEPMEPPAAVRRRDRRPAEKIEPRLESHEVPHAREPEPAEAEPAPTEHHEDFTPEPVPTVDDYAPRTPSAAKRWLLGLGTGVLAGTLAVQSVYIFRDEIARDWPALRPVLLAACNSLGCTVNLPRVAGEISVDASDLQSEPSRPGRYALSATIRNRAKYAQAYPHVELTLTDARDRALARRVLVPQDWAPEADLERGLAPGREITINLPFEAAGLSPAGYRIYVFYP